MVMGGAQRSCPAAPIIVATPLTHPSATHPSPQPQIKATKDYMVRPPQPVIHLFLIEVSHAAVVTGATAAACQCIEQVLESIQGGWRGCGWVGWVCLLGVCWVRGERWGHQGQVGEGGGWMIETLKTSWCIITVALWLVHSAGAGGGLGLMRGVAVWRSGGEGCVLGVAVVARWLSTPAPFAWVNQPDHCV